MVRLRPTMGPASATTASASATNKRTNAIRTDGYISALAFVLDEVVEFAERLDQSAVAITAIELADSIDADRAFTREVAALGDDVPHTLEEDELEPLVEGHGV